MHRYFPILLLSLLWMPLGCESSPPPAPSLTDDVRAAIAAEDAQVEAEESRQQ